MHRSSSSSSYASWLTISRALLMAVMVAMCVMVANGAPRPTSSRVSMAPSSRASSGTPSTPTSSNSNSGGNGVGAAGGRHDEPVDDEFGLEDIAGGFAFKASGFVAFGGPGSAVPVTPGTGGSTGITALPTVQQQLWIAIEGRTCSDRKGRCAINAWVNVNGYQTFHIDTRLASGAGIADCQVSVDEFGQGVMVIPIQFTTDGGAAVPLPGFISAFPTLITVRFQAFDRDNAYLEIEGCGVAGAPTFGGPAAGTFTPFIQSVCSPSALVTQGRIPLALTGRASRIQFRCTNCKKDDFVIAGDCIDEDNCPAGFSSGHGSKGTRGRGVGNGGPFSTNSESLDL